MPAFALYQLVVISALIMDFMFAFWALRRYSDTGDNILLCSAIGSAIVTVTMVSYVVYFNRRMAVINHLCHTRCEKVS